MEYNPSIWGKGASHYYSKDYLLRQRIAWINKGVEEGRSNRDMAEELDCHPNYFTEIRRHARQVGIPVLPSRRKEIYYVD